jgi:hypothetical protein
MNLHDEDYDGDDDIVISGFYGTSVLYNHNGEYSAGLKVSDVFPNANNPFHVGDAYSIYINNGSLVTRYSTTSNSCQGLIEWSLPIDVNHPPVPGGGGSSNQIDQSNSHWGQVLTADLDEIAMMTS